MIQKCTLCDELCNVTPHPPIVAGEGVPDNEGVWFALSKYVCAGCARRVTMLFATRSQRTDHHVDDHETDDDA